MHTMKFLKPIYMLLFKTDSLLEIGEFKKLQILTNTP